jgi:hypothetical protein
VSQHIYVLEYRHRHGSDVNVYATREAAYAARAQIVMINLEEVVDDELRQAITDAYEADALDKCYDLYAAAVEDESIYIEDCPLRGAAIDQPCIAVEVDTDLVHRVAILPLAGIAGVLFCTTHFYWHHVEPLNPTIGSCKAYLPKDTRTLTCMQCIAAEQNEQEAT